MVSKTAKDGKTFRLKIPPASFDFPLLIIFVLLINLPTFRSDILALHDSASIFHGFYFFYNNLLSNNEWARWLPYGSYGIQADTHQIALLSPAGYFAGFLGWIFRVRDVLFLFRTSVLLEQIMFMYGTYLLSRTWFRERASVLLVSLGGAGSTFWLFHIWWNFRIYYLLPLVLYLFVRFLKEEKPHYFWLSASAYMCSLVGNISYFVPLHLLVGTVVAIPLGFTYRTTWKWLVQPSRKNILSFVLFAALAILYAYFSRHTYDYTQHYISSRHPETFVSILPDFLKFGGDTNIIKFLGLIFPGQMLNSFTLYVGLIPLLFFLYGLFNIRRIEHAAVLLACVALILFSSSEQFRGFGEWMFYYFPLMRYFRYTGHVGGVLRLFILFTAGFGLDAFFAHEKKVRSATLKNNRFHLSVAILMGLIIAAFMVNRNAALYPLSWPQFYIFDLLVLASVIKIMSRTLSKEKRVGALIILLAVEMLVYQYTAYASWPRITPPGSDVTNVHAISYQPIRTDRPEVDSRITRAEQFIESTGVPRELDYNFVQLDPCFTRHHAHLWNKNVERLFRAMGGRVRGETFPFTLPPNEAALALAIGCGVPKLRFLPDADIVFFDHPKEAEAFALELEFGKKNILENVPENLRNMPSKKRAEHLGEITVTAFSFNSLHATVNVTEPNGAWLYYADAFHPGWKAFVDDAEVPIYKANLAFKAIRLTAGEHRVRFIFSGGTQTVRAKSLVGIGLVFSLVFLTWMLRAVFRSVQKEI